MLSSGKKDVKSRTWRVPSGLWNQCRRHCKLLNVRRG